MRQRLVLALVSLLLLGAATATQSPGPSGKPYSFALTGPAALVVQPFQTGERLYLRVRLWNTGSQRLALATGTPYLVIAGSCPATGTSAGASAPAFSSVTAAPLDPGQYRDVDLLGGNPASYQDLTYQVACNLTLHRKEGDRFVEQLHSASAAWTVPNPIGGPADVLVSTGVRYYGPNPLTTQDEIVVIPQLTTQGGWSYPSQLGVACDVKAGGNTVASRSATAPGASRSPRWVPFSFGSLPAGSYQAVCRVTANDKDTTNNVGQTSFGVVSWDRVPPQIQSFTVTPTSFPYDAGNITIAVQAADNAAVQSVTLHMVKPDGSPSGMRMPQVTGTAASGEWRVSFALPGNYSENPLVWSMKVTAGDTSGNLTSSQPVAVTVSGRTPPPPRPQRPAPPRHP
jgi:hypothetical protein